MHRIKTFADAQKMLAKYVPPARSIRAAYTLDRMSALMDKLGNPQNKYKTIHIAGTSGKTSTCYYLAAMLKAGGYKAGLTVSPHIDEISERVQIDLEPLSEKKYCQRLDKFIKEVEKTDIKPTYFELLVAFAFWQFAEERIDYAVVEVGLGGLLDGTNVIKREDKICAITDISLDHTDVLGQTLSEIAAQKAGIITLHNPVFTYKQDAETMDVIREVCSAQHAVLCEVWPELSKAPPFMPLYQKRNWYLALNIYEFLEKRDGLEKAVSFNETAETYIPARMEVRHAGGHILIMDGAHNAQKMRAFADSVREKFPNKSIASVFSLVQSKKLRSVGTLKEIAKIADHIIITTFDTEQDMRKTSVDPIKIADYCEEINFDGWEIVADPASAYKTALKRPEDIIVITGSFYLLNHIRPLLNLQSKDKN